eukprot:Skav201193  [mRNA]  locus=scaffold633:293529:297392:- [translate_table: standard]
MAPLPQVHAERGDACVPSGDDPVLSALRRYRDAAGSTFHPQSEVGPEEAPGSSRFVLARPPALDSSPKAPTTYDLGELLKL